jgi:hypothetical protein
MTLGEEVGHDWVSTRTNTGRRTGRRARFNTGRATRVAIGTITRSGAGNSIGYSTGLALGEPLGPTLGGTGVALGTNTGEALSCTRNVPGQHWELHWNVLASTGNRRPPLATHSELHREMHSTTTETDTGPSTR